MYMRGFDVDARSIIQTAQKNSGGPIKRPPEQILPTT
jgi:hypothetical protein